MFKTLKVLLLSIILVLSFYSLPTAVEKSNIDSIISYTKNIEKGEYDNFEVYKTVSTLRDGAEVETTLLWSKENTAEHDYFDWKWTIHVLKIHHCVSYDTTELEITSRDYQDFVSIRSRGFIAWTLVDFNLDGKINFVFRNHTIIACEDSDCINNYIIMPSYPEGLINMDWHTPSEEEREKRYNKEIDYWMKTIWGAKEQ